MAYDSDALRTEMAARGVWANIRPMPSTDGETPRHLPPCDCHKRMAMTGDDH